MQNLLKNFNRSVWFFQIIFLWLWIDKTNLKFSQEKQYISKHYPHTYKHMSVVCKTHNATDTELIKNKILCFLFCLSRCLSQKNIWHSAIFVAFNVDCVEIILFLLLRKWQLIYFNAIIGSVKTARLFCKPI